ncbi:unnamed protein product [Brugia timori]|uniref:Lipoprotein n=1 Tax=Brugia timori TaxID=42155 RepID=A0A0R3Q4Z2_9BILA|nr:unnamed protein product [Brugia timori]
MRIPNIQKIVQNLLIYITFSCGCTVVDIVKVTIGPTITGLSIKAEGNM